MCSRYPFGMCLSRCPRASCLRLVGAGVGAGVVSAQQRLSTPSISESALGNTKSRGRCHYLNMQSHYRCRAAVLQCMRVCVRARWSVCLC